MPILKHQLSNGLQILCDQNFDAGLISVGYFVNVGSRDEDPAVNGVSHFLEHMCFKGTQRRTATEINQTLDELGANSNASTSYEATVYYATVLPDFQDKIVDLLTDMMHPSLESDDFQTEKKVILEEIAMYKDQPPFGGDDLIMENWFGTNSFARPILGTPQSVTDLDPTQMRAYHQRYYSPGNMILSLAGPVDFQRLVKQVEELTAQWQAQEVPNRVFQSQPFEASESMISIPDSVQSYVLQMSQGPNQDDSDRYAMRLATMVFADDLGSRLFWKLVDPGLVDMAVMSPVEFQGTGLLKSSIVCRPEDRENVWKIFQEEEKKFLEEGPSEKELKLAKSKAVSSICMAVELNENRMFDLGGQYLAYQKYETPKQVTDKLLSVTLQETHAAVQKYFSGVKAQVIVGP